MKKIYTFFTAVMALVSFGFTNLNAQTIAIHAGYLIDTESGNILKDQAIIINGDKINDVKPWSDKISADQMIDLSNYWVMPGLMDMHVHLEDEITPQSYLEEFQLNKADIAYNAQVYAKRTLLAGFTTVRDLGGTGVNTSLRNAINAGKVIGPRIYSAGKAIGTTGGHADPTDGYRQDLMGDPGPEAGVINGPYEARKAVRQRYKNGADVIKIMATGGVLSVAKNGLNPQFQMDELKAIVETANDYGMVTAAHAHGAEGMKRAVEAGINSIEHGTFMTDEIMDLMIQKGTYYVPTISAGIFVAEKAKVEGYYPEIIVPKALAIGPQIQQTFARAYQKGVKIAFGTDAGVFPHGENAKEFQYMVEAGMPPMKAIQSSTIEASKLLRIDQEYGKIKPTYYADIVAVKSNPIDDINVLQHVNFVMKSGVVYKND